MRDPEADEQVPVSLRTNRFLEPATFLVELFGVAWMPFHALQVGEDIEELPGYGAA